VNRLTENLLLFMVGLAIAIIAKSGTYTNYVKPSLLPWLVAAAALLLSLAVAALVRDGKRWTQRASVHTTPELDGHQHTASIAWLLCLPIALLVFVPAPALSASAGIQRQASRPANPAAQDADFGRRAFPPIPPGRAPALDLTEIVERDTDDTAGTLNGRLITVVGFTVKKGAQVDLARFLIICCAADAHLQRFTLEGPGAVTAAAFPQETWVKAEVTVVHAATPGGDPTLLTSNVIKTEQPPDPYEYLK
jgi:uncharacterized repeat protein (TIGR03943 family)